MTPIISADDQVYSDNPTLCGSLAEFLYYNFGSTAEGSESCSDESCDCLHPSTPFAEQAPEACECWIMLAAALYYRVTSTVEKPGCTAATVTAVTSWLVSNITGQFAPSARTFEELEGPEQVDWTVIGVSTTVRMHNDINSLKQAKQARAAEIRVN